MKEMIPLDQIEKEKLNPVIAGKIYDSSDISGLSDIRLKLMVIIADLESEIQRLNRLIDMSIAEENPRQAKDFIELKRKFMRDVKDTLVPLKDDSLIEVKNLGGIKVTSNSDEAFIKLCERWALYLEWVKYRLGPEAMEKWEELISNWEDSSNETILKQMYEDVDYVVIDNEEEMEKRKKQFEDGVQYILSKNRVNESDDNDGEGNTDGHDT